MKKARLSLAKGKNLFAGNNFLLLVTIVLFILLYIVGVLLFADAHFSRFQTFLNLLIGNASLIIISASMTMVLISGGIDISIGSVVAASCMGLAYMIDEMHIPVWTSFAIVLGAGLLYGLLQGFLIAYMKIQPFIVTLAGMFLFRGLTVMISLEERNITNEEFRALSSAKLTLPFGGYVNKNGRLIQPSIYYYVLFALVVMLLVYLLLKFTRFGRNVYAVGGNAQSASLMGLNVRWVKMRVYILNGFLVSLGGIVYCLFSPGGTAEKATGMEIEAIASSVIGGTLLTGGVGNMLGTLIGVLIRATIQAFITASGKLNSWWSLVLVSALLAFFIILQSIFVDMRARRRK